MLDSAVYISLMLLEVTLYERIIYAQDERKTKEEAEKMLSQENVDDSDWSGLMSGKCALALKYLDKIGALEEL
jgi:uncharacterized lipoprotein YehR (DUF1307 family)